MEQKRRNFYFKNEGINNESVEVYVGQSSGKQLTEDLHNAQKEVLIISPYIDEAKIDELLELQSRGVKVHLAFSDLRATQKAEVLQKLMHQHSVVNQSLKNSAIQQRGLYIIGAVLACVIGAFLCLTAFASGFSSAIDIVKTVLGLIALAVGVNFYSKKVKLEQDTNVYKYKYTKKLNFKFMRNNFTAEEKMFVHSKIYVIDRQVAYLGSLNFTNNGFTTNFETRIRITNTEKIRELVEFIHHIFTDKRNFQEHQLWWLGKQAFEEKRFL